MTGLTTSNLSDLVIWIERKMAKLGFELDSYSPDGSFFCFISTIDNSRTTRYTTKVNNSWRVIL